MTCDFAVVSIFYVFRRIKIREHCHEDEVIGSGRFFPLQLVLSWCHPGCMHSIASAFVWPHIMKTILQTPAPGNGLPCLPKAQIAHAIAYKPRLALCCPSNKSQTAQHDIQDSGLSKPYQQAHLPDYPSALLPLSSEAQLGGYG